MKIIRKVLAICLAVLLLVTGGFWFCCRVINHRSFMAGFTDLFWRNSFDEPYLQSIRFVCLAMSEEYIGSHFEEIQSHASDIETRLEDSYCTAQQLKRDNHKIIEGYRSGGEQITLITESFEDSMRAVLDQPYLEIQKTS